MGKTPEMPSALATGDSNAAKPSILIVDDNKANLEMLSWILREHGYEPRPVPGSKLAFLAAQADPPALILLDINMPEMNGFEFFEKLKADETLAKIPVIFVTGLLEVADKIKAFSMGAVDYVTKPFQPEEVCSRVGNHLRLRRLQDEVERYNNHLEELVQEKIRQISLNVSKRKKVEDALHGKERQYRMLLHNLSVGVLIYYPDGSIQFCNEEAARLFGFPAELICGENLVNLPWRFIREDGSEMQPEEYPAQMVLASRKPLNECIMGISRAGKGDTVWGLVKAYPEFDSAQKLDRIVMTFVDVTARKNAEEHLRRLAAAIEQTGEAMCITDDGGVIQYVNPAFEQVSGYTREELVGQTPHIIYSGIQDEDFYRSLWETISGGETWEGRIVNKRKDGTLYTETAVISPIRDNSGRIVNYVSVKRDITEQLHMQAMLNQAQKMEVVGQLSGGIAHDFDNLLSIISCYSYLLLEDPDLKSSARPQIKEILRAGESASSLTRQLLMFSRRQVAEPQVIDLGNIVSEMNKMLKRLLGKKISISLENCPILWQIKADPIQMEQIVMNLAVNARDAMPDGGKITVKTENLKLESENHPVNPPADIIPGSYVVLTVCDTGCGMDEEVKQRIFEPFFTTKESGKGTGLGLATVYGIVKQGNGYIDVQSEIGKGTTFKIYFPRHEGKNENILKETRDKPVARGHETILLVVGESALLNMISTVLESFGYEVLPASTPAEAIRFAEKHSNEIHLLLADIIMPGMNGRELSVNLRSHYPALKFLFISGYAGAATSQQGMPDDSVQFIHKPFSSTGLAAKVRKVLAEK